MKLEFETLADIAADTTLADSDIVKHPDRPGWSTTVGELRAAQGLSAEQRRTWEAELGRRVGAACTIVSFNANLGTGRYQTVLSGGETVTRPFATSGDFILTPTYPSSVNAGGPKKGQKATATPAPDPYAKELAARGAEHRTPEQKADDDYKALRTAEFAAESRRRDEHFTAHPSPRLTAAELKTYASPDVYGDGIKALQARAAKETK
jgi:hypothetical protein